jgi:hypothetical protein
MAKWSYVKTITKQTVHPPELIKIGILIKKTGSYVYVIYSQDAIIKDKLMLYVDKKNDNGSYIAFDTQDFSYDPKTEKKKMGQCMTINLLNPVITEFQ